MLATDLINAILAIGILCFLAFLAGSRLRSSGRRLFAAAVCMTLVVAFFLQGRLSWVNILPFSSAIFLTNLLPIFVAFLAGFSKNAQAIRVEARPLTGWLLSSLSVVCLVSPIVRPLLAPPAVATTGMTNGVFVLQSHDSTCGPASAASLLRFHGINTTEADLTGPCLTSNFGTEALGLYRGLSLGCRDSSLAPRLANRNPEMWNGTEQLPNVALMKLSDDEYAQPLSNQSASRSISEPQWFAGRGSNASGHAVVVLEHVQNRWRIADPAVGTVWWTDEELRRRFTGDAIFLSPR
jgi:hypothetical protein